MLKYLIMALLLFVSVFADGAAYGAEPESVNDLDFEDAYTIIFVDYGSKYKIIKEEEGDLELKDLYMKRLQALKWFVANKDTDPRCTEDVLADVAIRIQYDQYSYVSDPECAREMLELSNKLLFAIHNLRVNAYLVMYQYGWEVDGFERFYDFSCHYELIKRIKNALPQDMEDFKTLVTHYPAWLDQHSLIKDGDDFEAYRYTQSSTIYLLWLFYKHNKKEYRKLKRLFNKYNGFFIYGDIDSDKLHFPENKEQGSREYEKFIKEEFKDGWEKGTSIMEVKRWFKSSFKLTKLESSLSKGRLKRYIKDIDNKDELIGINALYKMAFITNDIMSSENMYNEIYNKNDYKYTEMIANVIIKNLQSNDVEKKHAVLSMLAADNCIDFFCAFSPINELSVHSELYKKIINALAEELFKCDDESVCENIIMTLCQMCYFAFSATDIEDSDTIQSKLLTPIFNALEHKFIRVRYIAAVFLDVMEKEEEFSYDIYQLKWRYQNTFERANLIEPEHVLLAYSDDGYIMSQLKDMLRMDDVKWNYFAMRLIGVAIKYNWDFFGEKKRKIQFGSNTWMLIKRQLHNEDRGVRYWAVTAVVEAGYKPDAGYLISLLKDDDAHIRTMVLDGLKTLSGKDFGADSDRWLEWWRANKDKIMKEAESQYAFDELSAARDPKNALKHVLLLAQYKRADLIANLIAGKKIILFEVIHMLKMLDEEDGAAFEALVPHIIALMKENYKPYGEPNKLGGMGLNELYDGLKKITKLKFPPETEDWRDKYKQVIPMVEKWWAANKDRILKEEAEKAKESD